MPGLSLKQGFMAQHNLETEVLSAHFVQHKIGKIRNVPCLSMIS